MIKNLNKQGYGTTGPGIPILEDVDFYTLFFKRLNGAVQNDKDVIVTRWLEPKGTTTPRRKITSSRFKSLTTAGDIFAIYLPEDDLFDLYPTQLIAGEELCSSSSLLKTSIPFLTIKPFLKKHTIGRSQSLKALLQSIFGPRKPFYKKYLKRSKPEEPLLSIDLNCTTLEFIEQLQNSEVKQRRTYRQAD